MTRSNSRRRAAVLTAALFFLPAAARAAPESANANVENAKALYVAGKELRDGGDLAGSLEKFKAAHALVPTPITALEVGRAYSLLGKVIEAKEVLDTVERMPPNASESKKASLSRVEARELAGRLAQSTPTLEVRVTHAANVEVEVRIDDERIPREAIGTARKTNLGKHVVVARAGTLEKAEELVLVERDARVVTLDLRDAAPLTVSAPTPVPREAAPRPSIVSEPTDSTSSGGAPWLGISIAATGTSAAIGAITGLLAWTTSSNLKTACVDARCPPEAHDDLATVRATSTASTVAFSIAGVLAVTSVVIWLLSPPAASSPRAQARAR